MDPVLLAAAVQTIMGTGVVGIVISIVQERLFGTTLSGQRAFIFNVVVSVIVGIAAVANVGGFHLGVTPVDMWAWALEVLKVAGGIVAASKIAFEFITRPVAMR